MSFEESLAYTLRNEGGFSNVKEDKGGATNYGITAEEASRWLGHPVTAEEMKSFPLEEAKKIYELHYWRALRCDEVIHPNVSTCLFDIGVVRGVSVPARYAQRIGNKYGFNLSEDGIIGAKTLAVINSIDPTIFICEFYAHVAKGFNSIVEYNPTQQIFLRGWMNRAYRLLTLVG